MLVQVLYAKALDRAPAEFQLLPYGEIALDGDEPALVDEELSVPSS